jgi:hypothetical protein
VHKDASTQIVDKRRSVIPAALQEPMTS